MLCHVFEDSQTTACMKNLYEYLLLSLDDNVDEETT